MLFRRTDKYGYSRYYGGGGPALVIKIVVAVIVVIALVLGIAVFAMQKYMVYTANGGHLEFPWQKKDGSQVGAVISEPEGQQENPPDGSGMGDLIVDEEPSQGDGSASGDESVPPQTQPREPLPDGVRIQHVSIGDVTRGYAKGDLDSKNANGIMLYMKESSGKLNFVSEKDLAEEMDTDGSSSNDEKITDTLSELREEDCYTLAYVNCFQDEAAGKQEDFRLEKENGEAWKDGEGKPWADPSNEAFQDYLAELVHDLAERGYDEIVLVNAGYPTSGETEEIREEQYNGEQFAKTVGDFYSKLAAAVKDSETLLSVVTSADTITEGVNTESGQTLENMLQLGGRLWVEDGDVDDAQALTEALEEAGYPDNTLSLLVDKIKEDRDICQMNLD